MASFTILEHTARLQYCKVGVLRFLAVALAAPVWGLAVQSLHPDPEPASLRSHQLERALVK
jgi:hypothetical protein